MTNCKRQLTDNWHWSPRKCLRGDRRDVAPIHMNDMLLLILKRERRRCQGKPSTVCAKIYSCSFNKSRCLLAYSSANLSALSSSAFCLSAFFCLLYIWSGRLSGFFWWKPYFLIFHNKGCQIFTLSLHFDIGYQLKSTIRDVAGRYQVIL